MYQGTKRGRVGFVDKRNREKEREGRGVGEKKRGKFETSSKRPGGCTFEGAV